MHAYLIELLECPSCHGALQWRITDRRDDRIEEAKARCRTCDATYFVHRGIGLFLTPDLARRDLWEESDSALTTYLQEHPDVEKQLMQSALDSLAPADRFFRAAVLEEREDYDGAKEIRDATFPLLYTPEWLSAYRSQQAFLIEQVRDLPSPLVDLASGKCQLVEELVGALRRPVVATDFSPPVLLRDRQWLEHFGLYEFVSLLAMDARRTPFRQEAVPTLTTNLGLANIEQPGALFSELRRIVSGQFLSISQFYPHEDETNLRALEALNLADMLVRRSALGLFADAGWQVQVLNDQKARALPTPASELLEGAGVDAFPVAETTLEWCVLQAW